MKKCELCISLISLWIIKIVVIAAAKIEFCEKCAEIEDCPTFTRLTIRDQQKWLEQFPCVQRYEKHYLVCCPNLNVGVNRQYKNENNVNFSDKRFNHENTRAEKKGENAIANPGVYYPNQDKQHTPDMTSRNLIRNPYFMEKPKPYRPQQNTNSNNRNLFSSANSNAQCAVRTSLPPDPTTGCCGQDMSDSTGVTDLQNIVNIFAPPNKNKWMTQTRPGYKNPSYYYQRNRRLAENITEGVMLEDRIAGGKETELDQFPWTVLLNIIFAVGVQRTSFSCGGSLISQKYVLTAGHCIFSKENKLVEIQVTLAEYDKRTFPRDCGDTEIGLGENKKCITNILMRAKSVIIHPQYNDDRLYNDIALIELDGYAPYTRYVRPICLPPINIDEPEFSNLPLAAAGWGRNGRYITDVKQSTVLHLVPHHECELSYPRLSNTQICAAGRTGEDTCKGDSGGPLMVLYGANYYLVGVVSGKRSDSPCGSRVPSLYTNVYYYTPWIRSVIQSLYEYSN